MKKKMIFKQICIIFFNVLFLKILYMFFVYELNSNILIYLTFYILFIHFLFMNKMNVLGIFGLVSMVCVLSNVLIHTNYYLFQFSVGLLCAFHIIMIMHCIDQLWILIKRKRGFWQK